MNETAIELFERVRPVLNEAIDRCGIPWKQAIRIENLFLKLALACHGDSIDTYRRFKNNVRQYGWLAFEESLDAIVGDDDGTPLALEETVPGPSLDDLMQADYANAKAEYGVVTVAAPLHTPVPLGCSLGDPYLEPLVGGQYVIQNRATAHSKGLLGLKPRFTIAEYARMWAKQTPEHRRQRALKAGHREWRAKDWPSYLEYKRTRRAR